MRIDFYTRFVLTVIAACLLWLSFGGTAILTVAQAQSREIGTETRVLIAGWVDSTGKVHGIQANLAPGNPGIPVAITYSGIK